MTLPPYAPKLNPVENILQYLRQKKLASKTYEDYDEIIEACCKDWNFFSDDKEAVTRITTREWASVNV